MWEAHTLCTGTGVQVSSRWMVQCCCCHSNHRAKGGGGGGEGWVLRQERKWHKKRGREKGRVLLKGHSFVVCGRSFGDISDHKRWGEKGGMVLFDRNMGFNETYTVFLLDQDIPACPCFTLETLFVQLQPCFMSKLKRLQVYCVPASLLSGASLGCKHPVLNVFY